MKTVTASSQPVPVTRDWFGRGCTFESTGAAVSAGSAATGVSGFDESTRRRLCFLRDKSASSNRPTVVPCHPTSAESSKIANVLRPRTRGHIAGFDRQLARLCRRKVAVFLLVFGHVSVKPAES